MTPHRRAFASNLQRFCAEIRRFATDSKVLDSVRADSRRIRESSRRTFATHSRQIRASSRKFAQEFATQSRIRDAFAGSRKFAQVRDGFARIRDGFAKGSRRVRTDSRQVYASSPRIRDGFAQVRTSSQGFAPDITQFRDANARRCGVTSPVSQVCSGRALKNKMVASRNGREGLELNAAQDGGRVLTPGPARLETRRGRLKMWVSS